MERAELSVLFGLVASLTAGVAAAQHEGHNPATTPTPAPTAMPSPPPSASPPPGTTQILANPDPIMMMEDMEPMDHWMTMVHGYAFLTANRQAGPSGDREFESQNHLMLMAMRSLWGGKVSLHAGAGHDPGGRKRRALSARRDVSECPADRPTAPA
jgi:hypothetical protein